MGAMDMLNHLLTDDPAIPRVTVYNESTGTRLDFSAHTLENWTAKIANFLTEELEVEDGDVVLVDLPVSWQSVVIVLGCLAAGVDFRFPGDPADETLAIAAFIPPERYADYANNLGATTGLNSHQELVLVTEDAFGRGVEETGDVLPRGAIDFGPTVRFYGDQYFGSTSPLAELYPSPHTRERVLSSGWHDKDSFASAVLEPLAGTGSSVIVAGLSDTHRLDEIAAIEKVSLRL